VMDMFLVCFSTWFVLKWDQSTRACLSSYAITCILGFKVWDADPPELSMLLRFLCLQQRFCICDIQDNWRSQEGNGRLQQEYWSKYVRFANLWY
jgi:hypothetical protein